MNGEEMESKTIFFRTNNQTWTKVVPLDDVEKVIEHEKSLYSYAIDYEVTSCDRSETLEKLFPPKLLKDY